MKNKIILLLVLLFASCIKQDVYEFEKTSLKVDLGNKTQDIKLVARFQIIEEEGYCLYDFKTNPPDHEYYVKTIKFYDDKDFLLFRTDNHKLFSDYKDFDQGKTKIATRSLLEKVDRMEFVAY